MAGSPPRSKRSVSGARSCRVRSTIRGEKSCVLEMTPVLTAVVRCFGMPRVLDAFPASGASLARVAPDELWLLGPASRRKDLTQRAGAYLAGADPDGTAVDQSDGWAAWTLGGPQATLPLSRLSAIEIPRERPVFIQGAMVEIPAKALLQSNGVHLLVPAQFAHHMARRISQACADLQVRVGEPREIVLEHAP